MPAAESALPSGSKAVTAARAAAAKLGGDTVVLDVGDVLAIVDFFVVTAAPNDRQVRAIADEIEAQVKSAGGGGPLRIEGLDDLRWVLLDFGDVVAHVFLEEARQFYDLERLWGDVPRLAWEDDPLDAR